jgi:hypothetical protein
MFRVVKMSAFAILLSLFAVSESSAGTIIDPIVRTRLGTLGSIPIFGLPFEFDFTPGSNTFPSNPDPRTAKSGREGSLEPRDVSVPEFGRASQLRFWTSTSFSRPAPILAR